MANNTSSLIRLSKEQGNCSGGMLCIPSIGLGVAPFVPWCEALRGVANVWGARLPGREKRVLEQPLGSIEEMAAELADSIHLIAADRLILFGHCSGAFVAYELAHLLSGSLGTERLTLVVSAQVRPAVSSPGKSGIADMSLDELTAYLRRMGGTPEDILLNRELMELMEPTIRADILAVEKYHCPPRRPSLSISLIAIGGKRDPMISESELCQWKDLSAGPFLLKLIDGDHFYMLEENRELAEFLRGLYG